MEREELKRRILAMLDDADTVTMKLIYRFVCGTIYKRTK